jgi:hypothetical protein
MITPRSVLMVKPWDFAFSEESAQSNSFQRRIEGLDEANLLAISEYEKAVAKIRAAGVEVLSFEKKSAKTVTDAVFPNNWVGFHPEGKVILYSMTHENRRLERNTAVLDLIEEKGHRFHEVIDLSPNEKKAQFLEGTGSMVIDYANKIAYACISPRTSVKVLNEVCDVLDLTPFSFYATDLTGKPIYHTNVILTITEKLAIVCLECIDNSLERTMLRKKLESSGLEILEVSFKQVEHFCGNAFELINDKGESHLLCSLSAWNAFTTEQQALIKRYHTPLTIDIPTIETIGGGSARCMVAGVYF